MKKLLEDTILSRRAFEGLFEKLWLVLFMMPWKAEAQGCCVNYFIDCSLAGYSNCDSTYGFFAGNEPNTGPPYISYAYYGACIYCTSGCTCCAYVDVTAEGFCCGHIEEWGKYMCCTDPDCGGCG